MTPMCNRRRKTRRIMPMWTGESLSLSEVLSYCQSSAAVRATVRVVGRAQPQSAVVGATVRAVLRAQLLSEC
jgi:hypothetical protein